MGDRTAVEDVVAAAQVLQAFDEAQLIQGFRLNYGCSRRTLPRESRGVQRCCASLSAMAARGDQLAVAVRWALDRPWVSNVPVSSQSRVFALLRAIREHFVSG
jgi:hypothetical protein